MPYPPPTPKWENSMVLTTSSLVAEAWRQEESLLGSCSQCPLIRREYGNHQWRQLTLNLLNMIKRIKEKKFFCSMFPPFSLYDKRKSFIQFNILAYKLVRTLGLKSCFGTTLGESKYTIIERCYQVHFLTWWVISLHDILENDEWSITPFTQ